MAEDLPPDRPGLLACLLAALALAGCGDAPRGGPLPEASVLEPLDLSAPPGKASAVLRAHLADADYGVREAASGALEALRDDGIPLIAALYADPDPEVSWRLRRALDRLGWPTDPLLRRAAAAGPVAAPLVASALREALIDRAGPAILALGRMRGPETREAVSALATDPDPTVRYHAARALGGIGDDRAIPLLERLGQDENQGVRFASAGALARLGRPQALETLSASLKAQLETEGREVSAYNLGCLAALSGRPEEAVTWLERAAEEGFQDPRALLSDPDLYDLRGHPAWEDLLRRMGGEPPQD